MASAAVGEHPRRQPARLGPPGGAGGDATDEVDRLSRSPERAAAEIGVVLAVAEDPRPPLPRIGLVGGRAPVGLVERSFADDRAHGDVGRRAEPLVQLEVRVSASRHEKRSSKPPTCSSWRSGDEQAVALPHAVEPVAVADEVADLEQAVAVARPLDPVEEAILEGPVVAVVDGVALLARSDVPLLRGDDRWGVGGQPLEAEPQDARREHVGAVDHEGEGPAAADLDPAVERPSPATGGHPRRGPGSGTRDRSRARTPHPASRRRRSRSRPR